MCFVGSKVFIGFMNVIFLKIVKLFREMFEFLCTLSFRYFPVLFLKTTSIFFSKSTIPLKCFNLYLWLELIFLFNLSALFWNQLHLLKSIFLLKLNIVYRFQQLSLVFPSESLVKHTFHGRVSQKLWRFSNEFFMLRPIVLSRTLFQWSEGFFPCSTAYLPNVLYVFRASAGLAYSGNV